MSRCAVLTRTKETVARHYYSRHTDFLRSAISFALRFPRTFYVVAALILIPGVAAIRSIPTDTFEKLW